jgi:hypothetical protein
LILTFIVKEKQKPSELKELSIEQRKEIAAWFEANNEHFPEVVRIFLSLHQKYIAAEGADARKSFDSTWRELRRALGITPSSEKRSSGRALAGMPREKGSGTKSKREKLEERIGRTQRLGDWYDELSGRHKRTGKRLREKLAKMPKDQVDKNALQELIKNTPVEEIPLTEEERARSAARGRELAEHMTRGDGADPAYQSVNETLMPGGAALCTEEQATLKASIPEDLANAKVVKQMSESRVRYDFAVSVKRIELEVEKKVVEDEDGERYVFSASTREYGPPGYSVTWSALATLATMVGQFAIPLNRLGTMLSTTGKCFTAGTLSRMLHYVAERFLPVYLELAAQLVNCEILAGDDTSCRVLDVSGYFEKKTPESNEKPPWEDYKTPTAAKISFQRCMEKKKERIRRREDGDREAKRTPDETPSLGVLIGRKFVFESQRRNGDGPKQSLNTTVVSGRSIAEDPLSLIVFYRSHLGGCGDLFESILKGRDQKARDIILQGDLSPTNLVTSPALLEQFNVKHVGCTAHARRPFANYEHEDPENCAYMLHLFLGLALFENRLDVHGRNRENVTAVRGNDSRRVWNDILELATNMTEKWSKASKLGAGARYIINNFEELTAYLDIPQVDYTNNLRERMLRMEKLIEGSSMFRRSLEGRFVLDIVRTVLQTAVAAGIPVHEYLVSVLCANPGDVARTPSCFTPRAWAVNTKCPLPSVASTSP